MEEITMPCQVSADGSVVRGPLRGQDEALFLDVPYRKVQTSSIPQHNSAGGLTPGEKMLLMRISTWCIIRLALNYAGLISLLKRATRTRV